MRDYGKVYATFWSSGTTGSMSDDAKILALYLMTCSHSTIAGVFRLPDGYVSEDLGWSQERVSEGFGELFSKGFANRCATTKWVWVCKHFEWNKPENPNQRKSAAKIALSIPDECSWKQAFMRVSEEVLAIKQQETSNPSGTLSEPLLNQKQEQKQKQEQNSPSLRSGESAADAASPPPAAKPKTRKAKSESMTLATYLADCKAAGKKPIPDGHYVRQWADDAGITSEMLQIAWIKFRERYTDGENGRGKRYKDWPAHFATAVKENWFKVWFANDDGMAWTTAGFTCKTVLDAKHRQQEAEHAA